ncbi:MAG TPA: hypothetical protein VIM10_05950 [Actinopolymorphaceae bacterium]|jgi:hypothetical protein
MTHTPVPPRPILSADGRRIACPAGEGVWLIDAAAPRRVPVPHVVELAAWGSSGLAVAGGGSVSGLDSDGRVSWTRTVRGEVPALALADGVLAIAVSGDRSSVDLLDPVTAGPIGRIDLGTAEFEGLLASGDRILVWGVEGPDDGAAAPWLGRLVSTAGVELWAGDGAPAEPQGVLWPLSRGASARQLIGVFDVSSLTILQHAADGWAVLDTRPWAGRGLTSSSPGGRFVATLTADWDGNADLYSVGVLDLHTDATVFETAVEEPGQFPAVAVDDDARLTLASGFTGAELSVLTFTAEGSGTVRHRLA